MLLSTFAAALAAAPQADAREPNVSGGPLSPEQAAYDVRFYDLELAVDPERRALEGTLTLRADVVAPLGVLVVDLDAALSVHGVREDGVARDWERSGHRVRIDLGRERAAGASVEVEIDYGGVPREAPRPPWEGGFTWAETAAGAPWIGTSCQGQGADLWWPCKDHPSDEPDAMGLHFRVPAPLVAASNGRLVSVDDNGDGTRTFHWFVSTPINPYGVALNVAPYRTVHALYESIDGSSFPVTFWCLPESEEQAAALMPEILEQLAFFERYFGPYPFRADKYGVVETPFLGMEHQTIIAYGYGYRKEPKWGYDWLHHHELSHEWWGNLVTNADWTDMWIHEGIGTYTQHLWIEDVHGPDAYFESFADTRRSLRNRQPVAPRRSRDSREVYFDSAGRHDNDLYYKGAWVMHTLRWTVGDEAFFATLRRMAYPDEEAERRIDGSSCRTVTTDDFVAVAEAHAGAELDWFFDVYLRRAALPRLLARRTADALELSWEAPDGLPFPMPVEVAVGGERRRVEVPAGGASVPAGEGTEVEVDPFGWLLRAPDEGR